MFAQLGLGLTKHAIVGAGDGPCVVFAVGARENTSYREADGRIRAANDWGGYPVDEAALRHGAGVERETTEPREAYARFPSGSLTRYRQRWLPD